MIRNLRSSLVGPLIALTLSGCSTVVPIAADVDIPGMPNPEVALQKSLDETSHELTRIGAIEPSRAVAAKPPIVAGELDRVVSLQWNGPLDGAVKRLAETIRYRTAISGNGPKGDVNVTVDPAPRRVYDILQALGHEVGAVATVRVDQQRQLIEVIYHG
jgi:defect in organelle trafficking protein DotD